MTQRQVVPFDAVDELEPGMLYSDRLGPWFDLDGSEIIPVATEAVEGAVERIIDTFQLWSNLHKIDGTSVAIDFPLLTQLIQADWDRVMGGEDGQLPGKGFLIAYHSSAAAHRRRLVVSAPDGTQGRPAAHQERPRRSTGHDRHRAGELAAGPSRGRVASEQARVACWPVYRPPLRTPHPTSRALRTNNATNRSQLGGVGDVLARWTPTVTHTPARTYTKPLGITRVASS
jgi:hypothetical protein